MAKTVQVKSVVQDFNDDYEQSSEVRGLPLAVGLVRSDESKRIVDKRGSFDMDQLAAQLTELATRRTGKTSATAKPKQPKQQVHSEVGSIQSYLSRLELLQAMMRSETILEQLASLGLKWGESAEIDQKFTSAMQDAHLTIETLRQVRHAMSDFDIHCDMDNEPQDMRFQYPKELNEAIQGTCAQTAPRHHFTGHSRDASASTQYHNARVLGGTSSPHAALKKSAENPMDYQHSAEESHDHSAFVGILKQLLSHSDLFCGTSPTTAESPPMPRWVKPLDHAFSGKKNTDKEFQDDFCQVIQHGLEMEHLMPNIQLPPVTFTNSSHRVSSHPDDIDIVTRAPQPMPSMSSWESAGDIKYHADTIDDVTYDVTNDADIVFERGMSALLPSFFPAHRTPDR